MTSTIIVKTDSELKKEAQKIAFDLGLTLSAVINNHLKDFTQKKSISFKDPYGSLPGEPIPEREFKQISADWQKAIEKIGKSG